jgi:hypothetical protein
VVRIFVRTVKKYDPKSCYNKINTGGDMIESQITKLEKEIEKKIQSSAIKQRKDPLINLKHVKKLAQKIREFESQPDAAVIR